MMEENLRSILLVVLAVVVVFVVVALVVFFRTDSEPPVTVVQQKPVHQAVPVVKRVEIKYYPTDSVSISKMNDAIETLKKTCIFVKNYLAHSTVTCSFQTDNHDYRSAAYGWKEQIDIEIAIPATCQVPEMAGQTLYFYIGNGSRPGIVVNKPQAALLCKIEDEWNGSDRFISVDEIPFLK